MEKSEKMKKKGKKIFYDNNPLVHEGKSIHIPHGACKVFMDFP